MSKNFKYIMGALLVLLTIIISVLIVNLVEVKDNDAVKGELVIWVEDNNFSYLDKSANDFMELNGKVDIKVMSVSSDEILAAISSGNSIPDIVQLDSKEVRELAKTYNCIYDNNNEDVISSFSKNYMKSRINEVKDGDNFLGIPMTSRPLVLYLREDMLEIYGYKYSQVNTWDDLIAMGKDIKEKSGGKVSILNAVDKDYEDLISLIIMQGIEKSTDEEDVKEYVENTIDKLTESGILNKDKKGQFLARISSNNDMYELSNINEPCKWIACNVPSVYNGGNKFYNAEGDNLVILKNYDKNNKLIKKFFDYISNNNKAREEYILSGKFFSSFISSYKNKAIETNINNFSVTSPVIVMDNVYIKSPSIENYDLYFKIKKEYK